MSSTSRKIVLTGASGGLGSAVLKHLRSLVAPTDLVLALHDPRKAPKDLVDAGAQTYKIDYDVPSSLDEAFRGAAIVFLVSFPSIQHQERFERHKNAIDAAIRQGVQHIFYTSLAFGGNLQRSSRAFVMQAHLSTEAYLESVSSSIGWTAIREGLYSESYSLYFGFFNPDQPQDEVAVLDDGGQGIAFAAREDLGEATARIIHALHRDGPAAFPYVNQRVLLSGPEAVPLSGVAKILTEQLGRPESIHVRQVGLDEYIRRSAHLAIQDKDIKLQVREWATVYEAIRAGETAVVSPALKQWLGREPEPFETTLAKVIKSNVRHTDP